MLGGVALLRFEHREVLGMGSKPPALAPLAFCGLGTLGVLICAAPSDDVLLR